MPYVSSQQDQLERNAKIVADIFCAAMLLAFSIVFFGLIGGIVAFAVVESCLLAVDWLVPSDEPVGTAVR